jgi:hypothetical protein
MNDPKQHKPPQRSPVAPAQTTQSSTPPKNEDQTKPAGRVVHDSRGNAVWNWMKETGRFCIESTSSLLRRLEVPGLTTDDERKDGELGIENDDGGGGGGGYNPYDQGNVPKAKRTPRK